MVEQFQPPVVIGLPVKYLVLCLLVVQNAGAVLLMRAVRALPGETDFITQTAVIMQESLKAVVCVMLMVRKDGTVAAAYENRLECIKTAVPAVLYLFQNNLQYVAMSYLDAPTYAVIYQTKLLWVAVCSVLFLNKTLERHQWFALVLLMSGVGSVQFSQASMSGANDSSSTQKMFGMLILLMAAFCSSLAAVSFEKLLKGVQVDLWTRNFQLAIFSIMCSVVPLLASQDGKRVLNLGFFHGYTWLTWSCIAMNAFGGLLVGAVISYCDAILKDIAIGASIVVSAAGSMYLFNFEPEGGFTLGVALVSYAVPLYAGRAGIGMGDSKQCLFAVFEAAFWQKGAVPVATPKIESAKVVDVGDLEASEEECMKLLDVEAAGENPSEEESDTSAENIELEANGGAGAPSRTKMEMPIDTTRRR